MKLNEILSEHEIKVDLEAEDKNEAIEELIDLLISEHILSLRDRDATLDAVLIRERSISTGVGEGVAIPHGSVDCVEEIVASIGISRNGIDFDSFDGEPVYIVLLLLVPRTSFGKHIKTLAHIARILSSPGIRDKIRSASSAREVFDLIETVEQAFET